MRLDTLCPACRRLDEDGGHCFLKCKLVRLGRSRARACPAGSAVQEFNMGSSSGGAAVKRGRPTENGDLSMEMVERS